MTDYRLSVVGKGGVVRQVLLPEAVSRALLSLRGSTLGHDNIATTSGYLHARPESSSGLKLDPGVFLR
jgi:hypothetical protein